MDPLVLLLSVMAMSTVLAQACSKDPRPGPEQEEIGMWDEGPQQPQSRSTIGDRNALHEEARRGDAAGLHRLIVTQDVDLNWADALGRTALHYAAANGYLEVVEVLLDAGAQVNPSDNDGFTPLHRAVQGAHRDVVRRLMENGADLTARTGAGDLPIDLARENQDSDMVELLQGQGKTMQ
jgi:ankyrin repeat protein